MTQANEYVAHREHLRRREADRAATLRAQYKYVLLSGDYGDDSDERGWRSYTVHETVCANTLKEFFDAVTVSEVDQDGGDHACYGFEDAPAEVQAAICICAGISPEDAEAFQ